MKHKENLRFVGLLVLVMLASTLFIPLADAATYRYSEAQITTNISSQENPDLYVSGNNYKIVYQDNRNGNWDIYMYDAGLMSETRITTNTANQMNPKIYGDIIVWQDERNSNWDIYMYNITSKIETQVTNNTAHQNLPAIDGNRIVWQDTRNGRFDIYLYDSILQTEQRLTTGIGNDSYPVICGDIVAYRNEWKTSSGYLYSYIYYHNLSSNQQVLLTTGGDGKPDCIVDLAIDGTRVVWTARQRADPLYGGILLRVHMKDIVTGIHWQTWGNYQEHPDISGNCIVYENETGYHEPYNIYLFDLAANQEYKVTNITSSSQFRPVVSSGWINGLFCIKVVYMDDRNQNFDLFETSRWTIPEPIAQPPKPRPYDPNLAINEAQTLQNRVADTSLILVSDFEGANMKVKENRRNAMLNQLESVVASIQTAANADDSQIQRTHYQNAIDQLNVLITKTDGYILRGTPDKPGSRYTPDWITNSIAQSAIYPQIKECLTILQMLVANLK